MGQSALSHEQVGPIRLPGGLGHQLSICLPRRSRARARRAAHTQTWSRRQLRRDNYFQYINVPAPATFEWGYRRGNPDHNREEYLSQKDHTFKAKLKWHDGYEGHGEHYWDYNHVGPKEPAYAPPAPAYAPPKPAYAGPGLA